MWQSLLRPPNKPVPLLQVFSFYFAYPILSWFPSVFLYSIITLVSLSLLSDETTIFFHSHSFILDHLIEISSFQSILLLLESDGQDKFPWFAISRCPTPTPLSSLNMLKSNLTNWVQIINTQLFQELKWFEITPIKNKSMTRSLAQYIGRHVSITLRY